MIAGFLSLATGKSTGHEGQNIKEMFEMQGVDVCSGNSFSDAYRNVEVW